MIDNLPYKTIDFQSMQNAYSNDALIFISDELRADKKTGELFCIHKRKYKNLTFIFKLEKLNNNEILKDLTVRGSIHYLFNDGVHNANNFTFKDFKTTITKFANDFGIDLNKCTLLPPEHGLNINLDEFSNYIAEEIILNIISEQRKMFQNNPTGVFTSKISGTYRSETRIKAYVKSAESDFKKYCKNTLRLEVQEKKTRNLNKNGIIKVSDLFDINSHIYLMKRYIEHLKRIVIYDYTIELPVKSKYREKLLNYRDQNTWIRLIKSIKKEDDYISKYNYDKKVLNKLSKKYGTNLLENIIQHAEKQYFENLGICNYSTYQITKKSNYARVTKSNYAPLYNTCIVSYPSNNIINHNGECFSVDKKKYAPLQD